MCRRRAANATEERSILRGVRVDATPKDDKYAEVDSSIQHATLISGRRLLEGYLELQLTQLLPVGLRACHRQPRRRTGTMLVAGPSRLHLIVVLGFSWIAAASAEVEGFHRTTARSCDAKPHEVVR